MDLNFLKPVVIGIAKVITIPIVAVLSYAGYDLSQLTQVPVIQKQTEELTLGGFQPTGGKIYYLKNSITATQTTINLASFKEPVSGLNYTMSLLNTDTVYATLEPKNPNKSEFIKFTGITHNSDGSATLTGVTRGLPRSNASAGCTASTTLALSHGGQSELILSNNPCFYNEFPLKQNNETITGSWSYPYPTASSSPATMGYVIDTITGTSTISYNKISVVATAGETVSAGQVLYMRQSDGEWYKAGVATAEASSTILGIAQGAGTDGTTISGGVLLKGLDTNQSGLTVGRNYFLGNTAGTIALATSTRIVGRAYSTTGLYFETSFLVDGIRVHTNTWSGQNTFSTTTTITATSSLIIGSFPAYQIGKNFYASSSVGTANFAIPSGITKLWILLLGGGGGGGSSNSTIITGGSGAAGACALAVIDVSATSSVQFTIGAAGAGGSAGSGATGGTSYFGPSNNAYLTATGGAGGGVQSTSGGAVGGTATGGYLNLRGGSGMASMGGSTSFIGETIGGTSCLGGAQGGSGATEGGAPGTGGSGLRNTDGAAGKAGAIIIGW